MADVLDARRCGVLLHISSLPSETGLGNFSAALPFIDFLAAAGVSVWQVLPLGPTHADLSPYLCTSSLAGNPHFINLQQLCDCGWLSATDIQGENNPALRARCLKQAFEGFQTDAGRHWHQRYQQFLDSHRNWLNDFALFTAISRSQSAVPWMQWPPDLRDRHPDALLAVQEQQTDAIEQVKFEQFIVNQQWLAIKSYANQQGIMLFGDMPLYLAHDSAEVWANREFFQVDSVGNAEKVAGVPPDYFSQSGQKWGNPVYDWNRLAADGFQWWVNRLHGQLEWYDLLRIDHFRGFEACWEIPNSADDASQGQWQKVPGEQLLQTLKAVFKQLPLVAEDLGFITPEVIQLREQFNLPGMKVMQFAFDGSPDNPYLLHNHTENSVAYTGTHDNDTSLAWYQSLAAEVRSKVDAEICSADLAMPWSLMDYTLSSRARLVMLPMQDILALGAGHRLNTPGTVGDNWQWQFSWAQLSDTLPTQLRAMIARHHRLAGNRHDI